VGADVTARLATGGGGGRCGRVARRPLIGRPAAIAPKGDAPATKPIAVPITAPNTVAAKRPAMNVRRAARADPGG
jgi:hypothetical protein